MVLHLCQKHSLVCATRGVYKTTHSYHHMTPPKTNKHYGIKMFSKPECNVAFYMKNLTNNRQLNYLLSICSHILLFFLLNPFQPSKFHNLHCHSCLGMNYILVSTGYRYELFIRVHCTLLVLIDFCPVQSEVLSWSFAY